MAAHLGGDVGGQPRSPVDHRQNHPGQRQLRVQPCAHQLDRVQQLGQALERVVLALDRHEHAVGRRERVHGQRPQRGRAVDEDEVVAVPRRRERGR